MGYETELGQLFIGLEFHKSADEGEINTLALDEGLLVDELGEAAPRFVEIF